jgi:hypothetical protein
MPGQSEGVPGAYSRKSYSCRQGHGESIDGQGQSYDEDRSGIHGDIKIKGCSCLQRHGAVIKILNLFY